MLGLLRFTLRVTHSFRHSIAYLPSQLALGYFLLGLLSIAPLIEHLAVPAALDFLLFNDTATPRTLLSTLIAGMISLVVFSFSMVMSVLSQAGGNFSHKLVFGLVTERHHQWVLGHYLGTILFILMLLIVPADGDTPYPWRSLATYLAAGMVAHCLALFVYFIHKASQTVQVNSVVTGLHQDTRASLAGLEQRQRSPDYRWLPQAPASSSAGFEVRSRESGFVQSIDFDGLAGLATRVDAIIHLRFAAGDYTVEDFPLFHVEALQEPKREWRKEVLGQLVYGDGESIGDVHVHGLTQLMEVAVKALSPGINDPGTARLCINQLTDLLRRRLACRPANALFDGHDRLRVTWPVEDFASLLYRVYSPILHYGRDDISIGLALLKSLKTLSMYAGAGDLTHLQAHADRVLGTLNEAARDRLDREFIAARLQAGMHRLELPRRLSLDATHQ